MSRPGDDVRDYSAARDEAILRGDDISDGRDEPPPDEPVSIWCDGCEVCRAIERERERLWGG